MSDSMRDRIARELGKDRLHELDKPVFGGRQLSDKQIEGIAVALLEAFPWLADEPTEQEVEAGARAEAERIARHDGEVKAAALREAADAVLHNTADPVYVGDSSEYARGYRQGLRDAARALRRKAKQGDERCTSCGCELAYPTAVHLLDCRLTEKGQGDE